METLYVGEEQTVTEQVLQEDILAAADQVFSREELTKMSRDSRIAVFSRLKWVLQENPNPTVEELQRHRQTLEMTALHPALTAMRESGKIDELNDQPNHQRIINTEKSPQSPKHPISEDDFFTAVRRYRAT